MNDSANRFMAWIGGNFFNLAVLLIGWLALSPGLFGDIFIWGAGFLALCTIGAAPFIGDAPREGRDIGLSAFVAFWPLLIFAVLLGFALGWTTALIFAVLSLFAFFGSSAKALY